MIEDGLTEVLERIYQDRGFDFRQYKESNLRRRIERRLKATKSASYPEYIKILDTDPGEYKRLIDDLTIKVTEFFRDPEAWQSICQKVLSEMIKEKRGNRKENEDAKPVLRIWSAGCATGQEAYSAAILVDEFLGEERHALEIDVFGTDIDKGSLLKAEQAEYKSDIKNVPKDILDRYFAFNSNFRVKSLVKEKVQFKFHDLVLDEPLIGIDLILCRNVAIYFERPLQEKIFMDFYNGLNEEGYLFLGKAEALIGPAQEKFKIIDKCWRIYKKEVDE